MSLLEAANRVFESRWKKLGSVLWVVWPAGHGQSDDVDKRQHRQKEAVVRGRSCLRPWDALISRHFQRGWCEELAFVALASSAMLTLTP